jgi:FixJ family two-component response regulator
MSYTPICPVRQTSESRESPAAAHGPTPVVFIVNGDLHMRQVLHDLLSSEGFKAFSFESAAAYRAGNKLNEPACLILDVDLPDMSGLDLQHQVANTNAPVVFVTDRRDVRCSVRAIKAGAVDFLTTPLRGCDLLNAVRTAIAMHCDSRPLHAQWVQLEQRLCSLTLREREVLSLVTSGLPNKQSALQLGISTVTLQIHRGKVMQKMAARSLADLVRMSITLRIPLVPCNRISSRQTSHADARHAEHFVNSVAT